MQLDHHSCLIAAITVERSEVQPSRLCMSHSVHPQCCNEVFHLLGTFSGSPSLAVFSNSMGSKRLFHWRKLQFFWRVFHHRNETKLQICKSKVAIVAMRHGRANLVEVGIFVAGCTWEEHQHHKTFMSKMHVHMHMQSADRPVTVTCKGKGGIWQLCRQKLMSMT